MELRLALLFICCGFAAAKTETFSVVMDPEEKYNLTWSFDDTTPDSYVTFTVTCKTTGWVGLGMSPKGTMDDADIVFAWVDSTGKAFLKDTHTNGHGIPIEDISQDVKLISAAEQDGVTTVTFKRKINTCDTEKDKKIMTSTTRLIYAYGVEDPADNIISKAKRHHTRGVKSIYLLDPTSEVQEIPKDALHFDLKVNNYKVRSNHTTYYCSFHTAPVLDTKHHVVAIEPRITPGNEALVHHVLIYGCWGLSKEHMRNNKKTEGVCFTKEMPEFADACRNPVHAWTTGGSTFYFPQNTGYPIGASDGSTPEYFMMEMHYDNPQKLGKWVDSSGIRFIYTPTLRAEDTGFLQMGMIHSIVVPPQPDRFRTVAFCDGSCTKHWIPEEGITVYSYLLHSHLLGVQIDLEWFRDGKFVGMLAQDKAYDFNFQEWRLLPKSEKVLPGDTMKITCTYTDPKRAKVTYGGLSTSDEMCLAFLMYYPKQRVSNCESVLNMALDAKDDFYTGMSLRTRKRGGYANLDKISSIKNWTSKAVNLLQKAYDKSDHFSLCRRTINEPFENKVPTINPEDFASPKKEESNDDRECAKKLNDHGWWPLQ